eukprot:2964045-Heterocapsa_arctica.AAC.1
MIIVNHIFLVEVARRDELVDGVAVDVVLVRLRPALPGTCALYHQLPPLGAVQEIIHFQERLIECVG